MPYNESVYIKAKSVLASRKKKAEDALEKRHTEVLLKCPELREIEARMASQGAEIVRAIGMGADAREFIERLAKENLATQDKRKNLLLCAGYPEDYLTAEYTCKECGDTGSCGASVCECYRRLVRETALEELAKCSPLKASSFELFRLDYYPDATDENGVNAREHMTRVLSFCRDYADDFDLDSPSLVLYGRTGLGKTHLSLAIAEKAVRSGHSVVYDSTQNLMNKLQREHFGRGNTDETTVLLEECDLLILDDLGAEFSTQFTVAALYNILNTRILKRLPVIISTNLDMKELEARYTQRIASRVIGGYIPLYFCGRDIRQMKADGYDG